VSELVLGAVALLSAVVLALLLLGPTAPTDAPVAVASASASARGVIVGTPGGAVITSAPTPSPTATVSTTPPPVAPPTAIPTSPSDPAPPPTPVPTIPPPPTAAPTPAPTAVVVAVAEPVDAVASFYGSVVSGDFDAAYALWSATMKAAYPREENLDQRFAETASIEWLQLETVSRSPTQAQVQANFVETYESGASRTFIGYWDLILVDGRWLLDAPHY
jgi:hypothetical protein